MLGDLLLVHFLQEVLEVTKKIFLLLTDARLFTTVAQGMLSTIVFQTESIFFAFVVSKE